MNSKAIGYSIFCAKLNRLQKAEKLKKESYSCREDDHYHAF